ncbi:MAG: hypothetical protein IJK29_08290 [Bacteroidales bacterium]|jgi:hypothetical protein|nr:hypothetical protein [Bacteroidales bacterium]
MAETRNIAPMKLELLLAVVQNEKAAYFSSLIQSHKANLQLTVPAKGTTHLILNYLGLTEKPKSLVMSVVRADKAASLISLLDQTFKKGKNYKGIAFTVPMTSVIGTLVYGFLANDKRTVKEEA